MNHRAGWFIALIITVAATGWPISITAPHFEASNVLLIVDASPSRHLAGRGDTTFGLPVPDCLRAHAEALCDAADCRQGFLIHYLAS